jgi:hypothetical protein
MIPCLQFIAAASGANMRESKMQQACPDVPEPLDMEHEPKLGYGMPAARGKITIPRKIIHLSNGTVLGHHI